MAIKDRHQLSRSEPQQIFRRASLDHITFVESGTHSLDYSVFAPPRPKSAFARTTGSRPLPNIPELSPSGSESTEKATDTFQDSTVRYRDDVAKKRSKRSGSSNSDSYTVPLSRVPERISSKNQLRVRLPQAQALEDTPGPFDGSSYSRRGLGHTIPSCGQSTSPVRSTACRYDPVSSDMRRIPSRTFVRSVKPIGLLDVPMLTHPRVSLEMRIMAPLFVGGGTVEGEVQVVIDGGTRKDRQKPARSEITIARICVDIMGVEAAFGKRFIFRGLANELIDAAHPPPSSMLAASIAAPDGYWRVTPSISSLPFRLNLPINMGPAPYSSKHASIKYIICSTLVMRIDGEQFWVRRSEAITVLTIHDPEKALVNLPNPLTANDELFFSFGTHQVIRLTAGVHRQTWVSGMALFVDIYISNNSDKLIKEIILQLEKLTTFFDNAAASTMTEQASHLRLPDRTDTEIVGRSSIVRTRHGWQGIPPQSRDVRTCCLDIPAGLVTVEAGRFFGVRFFLGVIVRPARSKALKVQIPVTVIHPNSIDIPPNSLAQVASAIEHRLRSTPSIKRNRSLNPNILSVVTDFPSTSTASNSENLIASGNRYGEGEYRPRLAPGRVFTAPRRQSVEQLFSSQQQAKEVGGVWSEGINRELEGLLDESPRKWGSWAHEDREGRGGFRVIKEKPRLMRSTSGLGFDGEWGDDSDEEDEEEEEEKKKKKKGVREDKVPEPYSADERGDGLGRKKRGKSKRTNESEKSMRSEANTNGNHATNEIATNCLHKDRKSKTSSEKRKSQAITRSMNRSSKERDSLIRDSEASNSSDANAKARMGIGFGVDGGGDEDETWKVKRRSRTKGTEERALDRLQRELSAARRRSKLNGGEAGKWRNCARDAVEG